MPRLLFCVLLCSPWLAADAVAFGGGVELSGSAVAEGRWFLQSAAWPGQHGANASIALKPEFYLESGDGRQAFLFSPFFRLDQGDRERTHGDIRELTYLRSARSWEFRAGIRRLFWGVTESNHLVDFINQVDLVENIDLEDRLGQPMVNLALIQDWGTVDLFVLPGFRERTFPGRRGRLRTAPRVDPERASYESAAGAAHVDFTVRYAHAVGPFDLGLYHFWGTNREPRLLPTPTAAGEAVLAPRYDIVHQTATDVQATLGNWLWKLEALRRSGQGAEPFVATVGGFEYTFVGAFGTALDIGLLGEYHFDDRGAAATTPFNDDVFIGSRIAFNDISNTRVLGGVIADLDGGGYFVNLEASRRLGDRWKLELELRLLVDIDPADFLFVLRRDDYLQLELVRYF